MKSLALWLWQIIVVCFRFAYRFISERREVFSGLFLNAGLVFLGTMVLTADGNTELGYVLSAISFIFGLGFSKGGK
jgi:hypothetical protein